MRDASFPKHFQAPNNIVKYACKTNPSVCLEDYHLTCRAGGVDNDLFIIQFLGSLVQSLGRSLVQKIDQLLGDLKRSLPTTSKAHTCGLTIPGI
jgi:hypothetical protein